MRLFYIFFTIVFLYSGDFNLTEAEKKFIKTHTINCFTTTCWAPFNTMVNSKLEGIAVDYWKLISKRLHLKYKCHIYNDWSGILKKIKEKKADITISTTETKEKKKYAIFSIPYATFPYVIATKNNVGFIGSMTFLKNKKIVVGRNYTIYFLLKKYYPNFKIIEVENIKKALEMVSEGKAFAAIDILPVVVYHINKYQFANLKISGKTPWNFNVQFMIRKDYPLLKSAIDKAIKTITPQEQKKIYHKWITVTFQKGYTLKEILTFIALTGAVILLLLFWIYGLKKEIKKRIKQEEELKKLSVIDNLTGIYNRYKIETTLKRFISFSKRNDSPLSVIFFDIDHFKKINDTYGHAMGDTVLKNITLIVKKRIREYDVFGRWGGEEFIIILPNTDLKKAVKVANKLKEDIELYKHHQVGYVTCSFGVTQLYENDTMESLLKRVDSLMYKAKQNGRNMIMAS